MIGTQVCFDIDQFVKRTRNHVSHRLSLFHLKNVRTDAERLLSWERSTYESAANCSFDDQTKSPRYNVDRHGKTVRPPLSSDFLRLFYKMLPQELRDLF